MKLKLILAIGLIYVFNPQLKSQSDTIVDYLNYKFQHIDSNYKIHIDSATFDSALVKFKFYRERITRYQDSIGVVVMLELNDWKACNTAKVQLGFSWLRAGYHCWLAEKEVSELAGKMGINHPWRYYQAIMNPEYKSPQITSLIKTLDKKLHQTYPDIVTDGLTRKQFFMLTLKNNPVRIEDEKKMKLTVAYKQRHNLLDASKIGVGCEKEDCCQKPTIQKQVTEKEKSLY
jgi:hypothetical protein